MKAIYLMKNLHTPINQYSIELIPTLACVDFMNGIADF